MAMLYNQMVILKMKQTWGVGFIRWSRSGTGPSQDLLLSAELYFHIVLHRVFVQLASLRDGNESLYPPSALGCSWMIPSRLPGHLLENCFSLGHFGVCNECLLLWDHQMFSPTKANPGQRAIAILLVVSNLLKNISQLGWLFPTEWKNKSHVPVTTNQLFFELGPKLDVAKEAVPGSGAVAVIFAFFSPSDALRKLIPTHNDSNIRYSYEKLSAHLSANPFLAPTCTPTFQMTVTCVDTIHPLSPTKQWATCYVLIQIFPRPPKEWATCLNIIIEIFHSSAL